MIQNIFLSMGSIVANAEFGGQFDLMHPMWGHPERPRFSESVLRNSIVNAFGGTNDV